MLVEDGEDCESSGGGDTGGDSGGGGGGCPLDEGAYSSSLTFEVDDCGFGEIRDLALSVTCEGTEMSLVSDVFALRFPSVAARIRPRAASARGSPRTP